MVNEGKFKNGVFLEGEPKDFLTGWMNASAELVVML